MLRIGTHILCSLSLSPAVVCDFFFLFYASFMSCVYSWGAKALPVHAIQFEKRIYCHKLDIPRTWEQKPPRKENIKKTNREIKRNEEEEKNAQKHYTHSTVTFNYLRHIDNALYAHQRQS